MFELEGQTIKITLNSLSGFITLVGKVIKVFDQFVLIESSSGPQYVSFSAIKIIQVMSDTHEKN
jgi:hypothetical protein